jgi:hypothetical protein
MRPSLRKTRSRLRSKEKVGLGKKMMRPYDPYEDCLVEGKLISGGNSGRRNGNIEGCLGLE